MPTSTADKITQSEQAIATLRDRLDSHQSERQKLQAELQTLRPNPRDPKTSIAIGKQKAGLNEQISALDEAIALLTSDVQQEQARLSQLREQHQAELDEIELGKARDRARELAAKGAELATQLEAWLRECAELGEYNPAVVRRAIRQLGTPESYPTPSHYQSAAGRARGETFLNGPAKWRLPVLVEQGDRLELASKTVDISPPPQFNQFGPGMGGGVGRQGEPPRPTSEIFQQRPATENGKVTAAALGFSGPSNLKSE